MAKDNPAKRKLDAKRISKQQPHEVRYRLDKQREEISGMDMDAAKSEARRRIAATKADLQWLESYIEVMT